MRLATVGNLRVAAAAQDSFGKALQLGYRTGTITGMLTDGLGLLGGSIIFLIYGEHAYEALLGFGFGGTLLALFMRVGGGIYTKAADVGADLVGKVEKGIPEDDPRNAATIADNVGDNVGDCAGMAADIFESYEVTIVAAMILGIASFGHKGVIFPLLVRAIGVIASIISTYSVRCRRQGNGRRGHEERQPRLRHRLDHQRDRLHHARVRLPAVRRRATSTEYPQAAGRLMPAMRSDNVTGRTAVLGHTSAVTGLDMRAAWTCLIGIILAVALNKCTEYYTGTEYSPVKSLAKNCETGHATNIIQGFAVGYESTVAAVLIIVGGDSCQRARLLPAPVRRSSPSAWPWRHRHADADRQHDLDGRVRSRGRQRQRHRRNGLRQGSDGRSASTRTPGRRWPISTPSATRPRPSPRESPSARP